jgi:hypothetical protein
MGDPLPLNPGCLGLLRCSLGRTGPAGQLLFHLGVLLAFLSRPLRLALFGLHLCSLPSLGVSLAAMLESLFRLGPAPVSSRIQSHGDAQLVDLGVLRAALLYEGTMAHE